MEKGEGEKSKIKMPSRKKFCRPPFSKEHKEKLKKSNIKAWQSLSLRIKSIKIARKRWKNKTARKIQAVKLKKIWKNPELRKAMSEKLKLYSRNPMIRSERAKIARQIWKEKPYLEEKCRKGLLIYLETHPEQAMKFATMGKNPLWPRIKTKQGWKVRSKGEKEISDFLFKNKIWAFYEKYNLFFPETWTNPDFFLPKFNVFIEFYGGFSKLWKKKHLKNIIYKKYNIPVLAITPKEIYNLNRYLLEDAQKLSNSKACKTFKLNFWTNPLNKIRMKFLKAHKLEKPAKNL